MSFESWMCVNRRDLLEAQLHQRSSPRGVRGPVNGREESLGSTDPPPPSKKKENDPFFKLHQYRAGGENVRDTFCWPLRESSALWPNPLLEDYHGLYPGFNLGVATQHAHNSNIPEMVQAIFYAMVLNDVVDLGLVSRLSMDCIIWVLQKLDWAPIESSLGDIDYRLRRAQASQLANPHADPAPSGDLVVDSGLSNALLALSDQE
ncbi:hypothetical protein Cgig2_012093 [Carnegiea gigantea]|uniref:Uncharacterized protein n=1 Tax=Carnegiea gigantea TaxID=171969 RepID=A0A9Q1JGY7_9CARY|nr:hypothetical protein Cgig2_012093 [Carnegiea gigantea]